MIMPEGNSARHCDNVVFIAIWGSHHHPGKTSKKSGRNLFSDFFGANLDCLSILPQGKQSDIQRLAFTLYD